MTPPDDGSPEPKPHYSNDDKPDAVSVTPTVTALRKASLMEIYFPTALDADRDAVYVASFPAIIYFWPTILIFFFCGLVQWIFNVNESALGWAAVCVFGFNVLVIVQDFDVKKFTIFVCLLLIFSLTVWLLTAKGIVFPEQIAKKLATLQPTMSTDAYWLLFTILGVYFIWGMITPRFNYWRIEQNELIHYVQPLGRDMSIPRAGTTVAKENPDVLESLLTLGGGTLVIKREGHTVATIEHIPFLGMRMRAIEKLLSETRVISIQN